MQSHILKNSYNAGKGMLRVGIAGCGLIGRTHAHCYNAIKDKVIVVAIADICPEKAQRVAKHFENVSIYTDAMQMLENEKLDILDICLPTYLHTDYAVSAMKKGMNVFIEKPVCLTKKESELLLDAEKKTGVKVGVGHVIRFWDEYMWLKEAKEKGTYGKLVSLSLTRLSSNPSWSWQNWYSDKAKSGGVPMDLHIHDADFVRYLMDDNPDEITAKTTKDSSGMIREIDVIYTYGDTLISAVGIWDMPKGFPFGMSFRAKFEKAAAIYENEVLTLYTDDGKVTTVTFENGRDGYERELSEFADYVMGTDGARIATLSEAVDSAKLVWQEVNNK